MNMFEVKVSTREYTVSRKRSELFHRLYIKISATYSKIIRLTCWVSDSEVERLDMLSFSYYLHEKAEESRHNETMSFLIAVLGSIFLMGGIVQTFVTVQRPEWFLIIPYQIGSSPYDMLGFGFTLLGVILLISGIVLGVHYASQRTWYSKALRDSYRLEEQKLKSVQHHDETRSTSMGPPEVNPFLDMLEPKTEPKKAPSQS